MPQPPTLKIVEIFPSLQGEGLRQGEPTIFVRLAGCNLKCAFCDTRYAWRRGKDLGASQIIERIKAVHDRFPAPWVCLTGGEPLLQDLHELVSLLKKEKFKIQVETNATRYQSLAVDWLTVSPKPSAYFFVPAYRTRAKEVKLVVTRNLNLGIVRKFRGAFPQSTPVILQPQSNRLWSKRLAMKILGQALAAGLTNVRFGVQLQKILGYR